MITRIAKTVVGKFINYYNSLDNYLKALLFAIPISSALLLYLISVGAADLIFSNWFITLISVPTFFANQLSTSAYFGRITDLFTRFNDAIKKHKHEFMGTLIGMAAGIAVGIGLAVMHIYVPLTSSLAAFATILFTCRHLNIFAGLGNRVGRCADKNSRPFSEKVMVATAATVGLTLGIILFATMTAAMISVVGITSFFSGGAAIPAWIAGIIFVLAISSGCASTADYVSKSVSFIRSYFMKNDIDPTLDRNDIDRVTTSVSLTVKQRKYEYGGSFVGVSMGAVAGAIVVTALVATNPLLLVGVVGAVAGTLIIITCAGMVGSIISRLGRLVDKYYLNKNVNLSGDEIALSYNLLKKDLFANDSFTVIHKNIPDNTNQPASLTSRQNIVHRKAPTQEVTSWEHTNDLYNIRY